MKNATIHVRVDRWLKSRLQKRAKSNRLSLSALVVLILENFFSDVK